VAQIPDAVASQIVDMFSTSIDFRTDLRRGDRFNVSMKPSGRMANMSVPAASWRPNSATADRPTRPSGTKSRARPGRLLRLRRQIAEEGLPEVAAGIFPRLVRLLDARASDVRDTGAHKGVDFAAAAGTPIRASGDGVVDFAGMQNGYGNMVVIKHWSNYSTAYAT
jgi:murein DD-endopeptidase MepM/ murein hydrolase activator NlpD